MKYRPNIAKAGISMLSERCHGNICNLNVIVMLEFMSRDIYLLFAIIFS